MRTKRILTVTIFLLLLASVAVFLLFGPQIRTVLSPEVRYVYPTMREIDGAYHNTLPASAVWTGEGGETSVWTVSRSDEFPEPAFVVNVCPIEILGEADGMVLFGFGGLSASDAVIVDSTANLRVGMCVKPARQ